MLRRTSSSDHTSATPLAGSDHTTESRKKRYTKAQSKSAKTRTHKVRHPSSSGSSGIESGNEVTKQTLVSRQRRSDTSGCESGEAPIKCRKASFKKSSFTPVAPVLDDAKETKEGVKEVKEWAFKTRFSELKESASKLTAPKNHMKEGQKFMLATPSKIKSISDFLVAAVHDLKIGGYYLTSMAVYGGATGVLASCTIAMFLSVLPISVPTVVVALIVGGGIIAGACIGFNAANNGESLMPANRHWSEMLGMTNYWKRM